MTGEAANPYEAPRGVPRAEATHRIRAPLQPILIALGGAVDAVGRMLILKSYATSLERGWVELPWFPDALAPYAADLSCGALGAPLSVLAAYGTARFARARPEAHAIAALALPALMILAAAVLEPGPGVRRVVFVGFGLLWVVPAGLLGSKLATRLRRA